MKEIEQALQRIPRAISLEVTTRCNLDCVYCTKKSKDIGDIDISAANLNRVIEQSDHFDHVIICGIGESFCYPNLNELISRLADKKITIVTNGTIPINYEELNKESNIDMLIFSVDSVEPELLERICGRFNWDHLIANLKRLDQYLKESNRKINRVLNCTINEHNIFKLLELVDFANEYHFETIHFSLPRGDENFILEHRDHLISTLRMAREKALEYGIYYHNPFKSSCVFWKWISPYISVNGNFYACCETFYNDDHIIDIQSTSFQEIWTLEKYKEFQTGQLCSECRFELNGKMKF